MTETLSFRSCNINCRFYCVPCIVVAMCYYYILFVCICKYAYYSCTVRAHVDTIVLYIYILTQSGLIKMHCIQCVVFLNLYTLKISPHHIFLTLFTYLFLVLIQCFCYNLYITGLVAMVHIVMTYLIDCQTGSDLLISMIHSSHLIMSRLHFLSIQSR